jgi:uncharacterized protein (TIGR01244 family)
VEYFFSFRAHNEVAPQQYSVKMASGLRIFQANDPIVDEHQSAFLGLPLKITYLTPRFAVSGALRPQDFPEVATCGFKSILSNLPDGESAQYPSAAAEAKLAAQAAIGFRHVPTIKSEVFSDQVVEGTTQALSELQGPVLAHCASGLRSAIVWAAASARSQSIECILATLKAAGFDLSAVRDQLEEQRGRAYGKPVPPALECVCDDGSPP